MAPKRTDARIEAPGEQEEDRIETWTRLEEAIKKCNAMIERYRLMKKLVATDQNYRHVSVGLSDVGIANALRLRANVKRIMLLHVKEFQAPEPYRSTPINEMQEEAHRDLQAAQTKAGEDPKSSIAISLTLGKLYESTLQHEQACKVYKEALEKDDAELLRTRLRDATGKLEETKQDAQPVSNISTHAGELPVIRQFFEEHGEGRRISPAQIPKLTEALGMFPRLREDEHSQLLLQLGVPPGQYVDEEMFVRWMHDD